MKEFLLDISKKAIKTPLGRVALFSGIALTEQIIAPTHIHAQLPISSENQITFNIESKRLVQVAASTIIFGYWLGTLAQNITENERRSKKARVLSYASVSAQTVGVAASEAFIWNL